MLDGAPFESRVTLPPTTSLRQARAGDYIKVGRRRERFWARVDRVGADGSIIATVDNVLVLNPDLPLGVVIEVSGEQPDVWDRAMSAFAKNGRAMGMVNDTGEFEFTFPYRIVAAAKPAA